jgi:hypothetical protein
MGQQQEQTKSSKNSTQQQEINVTCTFCSSHLPKQTCRFKAAAAQIACNPQPRTTGAELVA